MFSKSNIDNGLPVSRVILVGLGATLVSMAAIAADIAGPAGATVPAPAPELNEIVVTGSSIAQKLDASSLPVTLITSEEIAKGGYTSATDLLQNLPGMQGFVPASSSVNGGGAGITTAAVHSLPSKYTLVLLDGQRVAGFELSVVAGQGFGVNLNSIPLDAIERKSPLALEVSIGREGFFYLADCMVERSPDSKPLVAGKPPSVATRSCPCMHGVGCCS